MFEPVNNITPDTQACNSRGSYAGANNDKTSGLSPGARADSPKEDSRPATGMPSRTTAEKSGKDLTSLHDVAVRYSIHEKTGKTMIKIVDKESDKIIREIPSEEDLERSVRLRMYAGQLFDAIA